MLAMSEDVVDGRLDPYVPCNFDPVWYFASSSVRRFDRRPCRSVINTRSGLRGAP